MTHKEFFAWLDGYLTGKLENKTIEITPIILKMSEVKDDSKIDVDIFRNRPRNPIIHPLTTKKDEDDLGYPPKIVM